MKILAIESSCDETAVAVVEDGQRVLSNAIASQIAKHAATGGVVPEVASREHMKAMMPVLKEALKQSDCDWQDIDAIAVTKEPGLIGSLLVGRSTAAALAFAHDKPLLEVNHVHGHLYANWLDADDLPEFPCLILTVSGGHNELVLMRGHGNFEVLGQSVDDAAGEAFDKSARLLGLGYPGGPIIEKEAREGSPGTVTFPVAKMQGYDFSFSGLKTAVLYYIQANEERREEPQFVKDTAYAFQEAVVKALVRNVVKAAADFEVKEFHLVGGVSANKFLRGALEEALPDMTLRFPKKMSYCTDNAAMIAAAAHWMPLAD